jgi:uncharacterized protein YcfJ
MRVARLANVRNQENAMDNKYLKRVPVMAAAGLALGLAACSNLPYNYQTQGTVIGGVAGGVVGNALCDNVLCTVGGALGGAYLGSRVGAHEEARQRAYYAPRTAYSYEARHHHRRSTHHRRRHTR